ncbi:MAG: hypothetical protein M3Y21_10195, partial [Candidatus Eremiobacteraeota bacterium]|nr:hypothetical protein [Candidatus Eremiobacteraeota bacterium]
LEEGAALGNYRIAFVANVGSEKDWNGVGNFVRRYLRAFTAGEGTLLAIAATGELSAFALGQRVETAMARLAIDPETAADVEISDETDFDVWAAALPVQRLVQVDALKEKSPSALRRHLMQAAETP